MKFIRLKDRQPVEAAGYRKHILLDGEEMKSDGARVQMVIIEPGDTIADHYHQRAREFYLGLQGRCELTVKQTAGLPCRLLFSATGSLAAAAT